MHDGDNFLGRSLSFEYIKPAALAKGNGRRTIISKEKHGTASWLSGGGRKHSFRNSYLTVAMSSTNKEETEKEMERERESRAFLIANLFHES